MAQWVKNPPNNAEETGYAGSIPGSGRCPGEGKDNPLELVLAWRITWTEEPGGLQSLGSQKSRLLATQQQKQPQ